MGSSVSINLRNLYVRRFNLPPEIMSHMPSSYYRPSITKAEIQLCQQSYDDICHDLISPAHRSASSADPPSPLLQELYDSKRAWFYSLLSDGINEIILNHDPSSPSPTGYLTQPFLHKMLEMIRLSFLQWNSFPHFQHQLILLAKECCHYGIKYQDFIAFGPILFHSLSHVLAPSPSPISQSSSSLAYSPELDRAWKSLYSSILAAIIPFCLEYEDLLTAPADAMVVERVDPPRGFESKPLPNEGPPATAPTTTPSSSGAPVPMAASSRMRMMTSLSNSVAL
jgi:hypothetical protein